MRGCTGPQSELEQDAERDPIPCFRKFLLDEGICDAAALEKLHAEVDAEVQAASDAAAAAALPEPSSYASHVYSEALPPSDSRFESAPRSEGIERSSDDGTGHSVPITAPSAPWPTSSTSACAMRCGATSASSSSARMSPTAPTKSICTTRD